MPKIKDKNVVPRALTGRALADQQILQATVAGGAAGLRAVAGVTTSCDIVGALYINNSNPAVAAVISDLKSEFSAAAGGFTNAGGTNTTNGFVTFTWVQRS